MSLYGYKKRSRPAAWTRAFPGQVRTAPPAKPRRIASRTKAYQAAIAQYNRRVAALIAQAQQACGKCPVVAVIPELKGQDPTITQCHHIYGRGHGGRGALLRDERLWLLCSAVGHAWIDAHRDQARAFGWLCPQGRYNSPVPASATVRRNPWGGVEVTYETQTAQPDQIRPPRSPGP